MSIELGGHSDGVPPFRPLPTAPRIEDFALGARVDCNGIAVLREGHRTLVQKCFFVGLLPPADFPDHVHNDFAGGVGAHVDGAEIHVHDDFAARLDGESLIDLFLRLAPGGKTAREQYY